MEQNNCLVIGMMTEHFDIGGPDAEFFILGGSLGGINSGVAAALMPEVTRFLQCRRCVSV